MLRISANLGFLWRDRPLLDRVKAAKKGGFDAVEFHYPYDVPAEDLRGVLLETGLGVAGLNTRPGKPEIGEMGICALPGREAEGRGAIDEALSYGRAIGAGYVHVMAGKPGASGEAEAHRTFLASLEYAAGAAEAAAMTIVVEPINPYDAPGYFLKTAEQAAAIIAELGRDNIKILFDCYHAQISGGNLTRRLEALLPLIGHIQIAGVPSRAEPDEGEIAYERLLGFLTQAGYDGFVGAEYRPRGSVEEGLGWLPRLRGLLSDASERDWRPGPGLEPGLSGVAPPASSPSPTGPNPRIAVTRA